VQKQKEVICISNESDADIVKPCQEIGLYLLECGYNIRTNRHSPFLPENYRKYDGRVSFIEDVRPNMEHFKAAFGMGVSFGNKHGSTSREIVKYIAAVLGSITVVIWPGKLDETINRVIFAAKTNKIPMFDISNPKIFDKVWRNI